ncbi:MAG: GAF domain-containing SpoIIE family protein phosphatase [Candidatus Eisenbacteria bacterium]
MRAFLDTMARLGPDSIEIVAASGALLLRVGDGRGAPGSRVVEERPVRVWGSEAALVRVVTGGEGGERERAASVARAVALFAEAVLEGEYQLRSLAAEIVDKYEEVNLLYDLGGELALCFDEKEIAEALLRRLGSLLRAGSAAVLMRRNGVFEVVAEERRSGRGRSRGEGTLLPALDGALLEKMMRRRAPVLAAGSSSSGEDGRGPGARDPEESVAAAPILRPAGGAQGEAIGAIVLAGAEGRGPFTAGDLKILNTVAGQAAIAIENASLLRERQEAERIKRDLDLAREIRSALLPREAPRLSGAELFGRSEAAENIGGDTYGYIPDGRGGAMILVGDVGGHDLGSALLMSSARATLLASAAETKNPGRILAKTNRLLHPDLSSANLLLSLLVGRYDARRRRLHVANAGHHPPLLAGAESRRVERLHPKGLILGVEPEARYEVVRWDLARGDAVLFYTDGIIEARSPEGVFFGEDRLADLLVRHRRRSAEGIGGALFRAVRAFTGGAAPKDDLTLVVLRIE